MSTTIEKSIIARALDLLREGHSIGCMARDIYSRRVRWSSKRAVRFCAHGAVHRATSELLGHFDFNLARKILGDVAREDCNIVLINEYEGKEATVAQFEKRLAQL